MSKLNYFSVNLDASRVDLPPLRSYLFTLMMRAVSTDGYRFVDPPDRPRDAGESAASSLPGCIIASPSYSDYAGDVAKVNQDYVYNWTRDAAITAMEIVAAIRDDPSLDPQPLVDYVGFARQCHMNAPKKLDYACFTIDGHLRTHPEWSSQADGPALQTTALLAAYPLLDPDTQQTAISLISENVRWVLGSYQERTMNLWEDASGYCLFARSVQLRCLHELTANSYGIPVPAGTQEAIDWLTTAIDTHWDPDAGIYRSVTGADASVSAGYDPNIDVVMAAIYGALNPADSRVLATAGRIRQQWTDQGPVAYPINVRDGSLGVGPLLGRYPGDGYDGDTGNKDDVGHPWPVCTSAFAELYYRVANSIDNNQSVAWSNDTELFFSQAGVTQATGWKDAAVALRSAGDRMLKAIILHSDHLELSEQFDKDTGYEKSVSNLTWSYAGFLSAARARDNATISRNVGQTGAAGTLQVASSGAMRP